MLFLFLILISCFADRESLRRRLSDHNRFDAPCAEALIGDDLTDLILQHSLVAPGPGARERCRDKGQELCEQLGANLQDTAITCVPTDPTDGFAYIGKSDLQEGDPFFCAQFIYNVNPNEFDTIDKIVSLADSDAMVHFSKNNHDIKVAACTSDTSAIWNLDYLDRSDTSNFEYDTGDGLGVTAYVIDTGVSQHPDFGDRILGGWNLVDGNNDYSDNDGHGTHVAGTIASSTYGVAKRANIWGVQIFFSNGLTSSSLIVQSISQSVARALELGEKAVINLSLGGGIDTSQDNAVNAANDNGIPVTVASGNSGENACLSSPARASRGICVSSLQNGGSWSGFSNWGECVDIIAPGSGITSTSNSGSGTTILSGTSMAAPHVAGVIAQIMSRTQVTDPATIKEMLYFGNYGTNGGLNNIPSGTTDRILQSPCIPAGPFNECTELAPCQNGAQCNDLESGYECICPDGFTGTNCQLQNECLNEPCQNEGICVDQVNGYSCTCQEGTLGDNCESYYAPPAGCECVSVVHPAWGTIEYCAEWGGYDGFCYVTGSCGQFNSNAIPGSQWQYCDVVTGSTTTRTPTTSQPSDAPTIKVPTPKPTMNPTRNPLPSPCTLRPCLNGGTCTETSETTRTCECLVNFDGSSCETEMVAPEGCTCVPTQHPSNVVGFVDRCTNHLESQGFVSWCYVEGTCDKSSSASIPGAFWTECVPKGTPSPTFTPTRDPITSDPTLEPSIPPVAMGCQNYKIMTRTRAAGSENSWEVLGASCQSQETYQSYRDYTQTCCLSPGDYEVSCKDSGNNGWNSGFVRFENEYGEKLEQQCSGWWTDQSRRFSLTVERPYWPSVYSDLSPGSIHELSGSAGQSQIFKVALNANSQYYIWAVYLFVGTGDANIYIRQTFEPSTTSYDCHPLKTADGYKICYFHCQKGGNFWILVHGQTAFNGYSLSMQMTDVPPDGESCPENGFSSGR